MQIHRPIIITYNSIAKKYEPLLLLPIGFGIFIVNFPLVPLMGESHGHPQLLGQGGHIGELLGGQLVHQ